MGGLLLDSFTSTVTGIVDFCWFNPLSFATAFSRKTLDWGLSSFLASQTSPVFSSHLDISAVNIKLSHNIFCIWEILQQINIWPLPEVFQVTRKSVMCELVSYPLILALVHIRGGHSHDHRVHLRVLNTSNTFIPCVEGLTIPILDSLSIPNSVKIDYR